jgi:plastocyanin
MLGAAALAALLGMVACGDDDDDGGGAATTAGVATTGAAAATTAPGGTGGGDSPAGAMITITEFAFPAETAMAAGGTLTVVNETGSAHTVTDAEGAFNEEVGPGETIEIVIDEPGAYEFFCNFHPSMTGVINVA